MSRGKVDAPGGKGPSRLSICQGLDKQVGVRERFRTCIDNKESAIDSYGLSDITIIILDFGPKTAFNEKESD